MNSNPSNCCGVTTGCCGSVEIPDTLTADLAVVGPCECLGDANVSLNATGDDGGTWEGTGPFGDCGRDITLIFRCVEISGPSGGYEFQLGIEFSDDCYGPETIVSQSVICTPLSVSFDTGVMSGCCNDPMASELLVTITD